MISFGGFHDSCLRDIYISTGDYVDEMKLENKTVASLLFQRQSKSDTVLELKFYDVQQFNYKVAPVNHNAVIGQTMKSGKLMTMIVFGLAAKKCFGV